MKTFPHSNVALPSTPPTVRGYLANPDFFPHCRRWSRPRWGERHDENGNAIHVVPEVSSRDGRIEWESNHGLA